MRTTQHRAPWRPLLATAAALVLLVGVAFAARHTSNDSLRPAATSPTLPGASTTSPSTVTAVPTSTSAPTNVPATTPPVSASPTTATTPTTPTNQTVPGSTAPPAVSTVATTVAPTSPTTVAPAVVIPAPSFTLQVARVGERLVFRWPAYTGADGRQYVLVRVAAGGLVAWPPPSARIAVVVPRITATMTALQLTVEPRRWVLAVVGPDRALLAVSNIALSE